MQKQKRPSQQVNIKTGKALARPQKKGKFALLKPFPLKEFQEVLKEKSLDYLFHLGPKKI